MAQYICVSCVSGVHLTLHHFCRCTTEVVLLQQGVHLGSLWEYSLVTEHFFNNYTLKIPKRSNWCLTIPKLLTHFDLGKTNASDPSMRG